MTEKKRKEKRSATFSMDWITATTLKWWDVILESEVGWRVDWIKVEEGKGRKERKNKRSKKKEQEKRTSKQTIRYIQTNKQTNTYKPKRKNTQKNKATTTSSNTNKRFMESKRSID